MHECMHCEILAVARQEMLAITSIDHVYRECNWCADAMANSVMEDEDDSCLFFSRISYYCRKTS